MSDILYDLVFKGDLVKNADLAATKNNVQALFKIDTAKVDILFSGKAVTLKKSLSFEAASKYRVAIKKAGAIVQLVEQASVEKKPSLGKAVFGAVDPSDGSSGASEPKGDVSKAKLAELSVSPEKEAESASEPDFELAPLGADVLASGERNVEQAVTIDLSAYALANQEGNLVETTELEDDQPIDIADSGSMSLAEAGEEILLSDQKHREPELSVDLSGISLAEPGAQVVEPAQEESASVDISHLSLAD